MLSTPEAPAVRGHVGIDVSKDHLDVLLLLGDKREGKQFTNTPTGFEKLRQWLERRLKPAEIHLCLEATGRYSEAIAQFGIEQGYRVSIVNPGRIKKFGESHLQRNKTDKLDAALIADYCRRMQPPAWIPPTPEVRDLQILVRHLDDLMQCRQQARNRLHAIPPIDPVVTHWKAQIEILDAQIQDVKQRIAAHLDSHPDLKQQKDLLDSIPGIGTLTIAKLIAECRDLRSFPGARQLVAFAGLNPRIIESGSSVAKKPGISRMGSASLRAALYMPAVTALRYNPVIRAFTERLRERGVRGKALVVAAMRKLLHLVVGVLKSGRPFDPAYSGLSK